MQFPYPARDWVTKGGSDLCECVKALRKMGQKKSKPSDPMGGVGPKVRYPQIPPDIPLGLMISHWEDYPSRWGKNKVKMLYYCMEVWGGKQIRGDLRAYKLWWQQLY